MQPFLFQTVIEDAIIEFFSNRENTHIIESTIYIGDTQFDAYSLACVIKKAIDEREDLNG